MLSLSTLTASFAEGGVIMSTAKGMALAEFIVFAACRMLLTALREGETERWKTCLGELARVRFLHPTRK
jgi:hypothetical protein